MYVDYEPPSDIPLRYSANYHEISAWVLQEYGLKVASKHVTQVKRKHGVITQGGQSRPLPEGVAPRRFRLRSKQPLKPR